jgi:hypothetical protein
VSDEFAGADHQPARKMSWLNRVSSRTDLRGLGVRVEDDQVSALAGVMKAQSLGLLKGAYAEVTAGTRQHRVGAAVMAAPLSLGAGLLIGLTKKSMATAFTRWQRLPTVDRSDN